MANLLFLLFAIVLGDRGLGVSEKEMFGSKSLKCLVCKALVKEIQTEIEAVNTAKKIEVGSFRTGDRERKLVPYARSSVHLNELTENICVEFEEYAQAREKSTGKATIIRIMEKKGGGMNKRFGEVDIIPDDDLNTRLKFYCESIVEQYEEDILELFADAGNEVTDELCSIRSQLCSSSFKEEL